MYNPGTLIVSALLTMGIATSAMAADMPKTAAPMSADAPAAASSASTASTTGKKKHKKKKAAAPTTSK